MSRPPTEIAEAPPAEDCLVDDLEQGSALETLRNDSIKTLTWRDITVTVKDRRTKLPRLLLDHVSGEVKAGKRNPKSWNKGLAQSS